MCLCCFKHFQNENGKSDTCYCLLTEVWHPGAGCIGGFAKRAHPARARYLNVNLARRNRDLQPGGKEIEGGGRGGGGGGGGGEGGEK